MQNQEAFDAGYVSGVTTSLEGPVQVVKTPTPVFDKDSKSNQSPGIFQLVIPAELVEETINENFYSIVGREILLLIMAIAILRIPGGGHSVWKNWASSILIAALVAVFMVWTVDIVLWLGDQIQQSPFVLQSSAPSLLELEVADRN